MRPLEGIRVIELAGLAPVPYCGMILADFGADVIRVDRTRPGFLPSRPDDPLGRGKRSLRLHLKSPEAVALLRRMTRDADVLLDPFRPGTLERLGMDPVRLLDDNPRLIVARLTGYGQTGPYASMAGHDINYIAVSGALSLCGRSDQAPVPPANLLGDFAGGGLTCALGILLAIIERARSGKGQIIDAAMVDGVASLTASIHYLRQLGIWQDRRGVNWFDTGAPWYDTYETSDGSYVAVGALEPQFFAALLQGLGLDPSSLPHPMDPSGWPRLREQLRIRFKDKTRDEWMQVFEGTDACVSPVLGLGELPANAHVRARDLLVQGPGAMLQPAPAPRLSRSPGLAANSAPRDGQHTRELLTSLGLTNEELESLANAGAVAFAD